MWNIRIVKTMEDIGGEMKPFYQMAEVYYDNMGKPMGWCDAGVCSESIPDMKHYVEWMLEAFEKAIVEFHDHESTKKTL